MATARLSTTQGLQHCLGSEGAGPLHTPLKARAGTLPTTSFAPETGALAFLH